MARYCIVTDLTRPRPDIVLVAYEMRNDTTVELTGTHGFSALKYDDTGAVVSETFTQRRTRLQAEFNAYADRLISLANAGDMQFDTLRSQAIGYRYPAT